MGREETLKALEAYLKPRTKKERRKNQKPELELTIKPCLAWARNQGFSVHVVESKAVYSTMAGRYLNGMTDKFMPDIIGCTPSGKAAFIEGKRPGALRRLTHGQHDFLKEKIAHRCFAVCVDSADLLEDIYLRWVAMPPALAQDYLLRVLPDPYEKQKSKGALTF